MESEEEKEETELSLHRDWEKEEELECTARRSGKHIEILNDQGR